HRLSGVNRSAGRIREAHEVHEGVSGGPAAAGANGRRWAGNDGRYRRGPEQATRPNNNCETQVERVGSPNRSHDCTSSFLQRGATNHCAWGKREPLCSSGENDPLLGLRVERDAAAVLVAAILVWKGAAQRGEVTTGE